MTLRDEHICTRRDRTVITRCVYWMNHGDGAALAMLIKAGYDLDTTERKWGREHRVSLEGWTLGMIHDFGDEAFAFLFTPQARATWWRRTLWRCRHPFAVALPGEACS